MSMRNLVEVIGQIINEVPLDKTDLISSLESYKNSAAYAAPEFAGHWWRETAILLSACIGEKPVFDWQKKVINIWMNTKIFDV